MIGRMDWRRERTSSRFSFVQTFPLQEESNLMEEDTLTEGDDRMELKGEEPDTNSHIRTFRNE